MREEAGGEWSFSTFSDRLTGYRLSAVLLLAHESGLLDLVAARERPAAEICEHIGWDSAYGRRFLDCLCELEILHCEGERYGLSPAARPFLDPDSTSSQRRALDFERQLFQSWGQLDATLRAGGRVFATGEKPPEELARARARYLGAMDDAAVVRAEEVWQCCAHLPERGTLLDLGAGSGAFIAAFLHRHPNWSALFCDLPEIVADEALHRRLRPWLARIGWCGCNLLDDGPSELDRIGERSCDLVLLSNLLHCQGAEESLRLLRRAAGKTSVDGVLLVHDFFADSDGRGALYDLHMMLNTYNGRAHRLEAIVAAADRCGLPSQRRFSLPSGTTLLACARSDKPLRRMIAPTDSPA